MRWIAVSVMIGLALAATAIADDPRRSPSAVAEANGASTPGALGSSCTVGPTSGLCADMVWPPLGLGAPLPVTPGTAVRITFSGPVAVESARVRDRDAAFAQEGPTVWRVIVPDDLGDGLLAVSGRWRDGEWGGDQLYAFAIGPAATLVGARRGQATIDARSAGTIRLSLVRDGRTVRSRRVAVTSPGVQTLRIRAATRARLRVSFTPAAGPPIALR